MPLDDGFSSYFELNLENRQKKIKIFFFYSLKIFYINKYIYFNAYFYAIYMLN